MSIFDRLFSRRDKASPGPAPEPDLKVESTEEENDSLAEILPDLERLRIPTFVFEPAKSSFTRLGGMPMVPPDFVWPTYNELPLSFIAQIDLETISDDRLPSSGALSFFYDQEQSTWGFDPKDRGSWRVYYFPDLSALRQVSPPDGLADYGIFEEKPVVLKPALCYPPPSWEFEGIDLDDEQFDALQELHASIYPEDSKHQLFGYPDAVQNNDMDEECQLASNGKYTDGKVNRDDPDVQRALESKGDWLLLFQVDSDDGPGFMWGDVGMLYFWIRKQDLAARNFDDVWMVLQCC